MNGRSSAELTPRSGAATRACVGALFVLSAGTVLPGCRCGCEPGPVAGSPSAPASGEIPRLPPLEAPQGLVRLELEGFGPAAVAVPLGAREPRPILVVLHGGSDRPGSQCDTWNGISGKRGFVLCPGGSEGRESNPEHPRFSFGGPDAAARELRAVLTATKERFGRHVSKSPVVLAGVSLGATLAAQIMLEEPSFFRRVVLVDASYEHVSSGVLTRFAQGGGERLLFVCSATDCSDRATPLAALSRRMGVKADVIGPSELGPGDDSGLARALHGRWHWVVAGDSRWSGGGIFDAGHPEGFPGGADAARGL